MSETQLEKIQSEHDRWKKAVGASDEYLSKYTIGMYEVLQAHFLLIEYFSQIGEGVGGIGPKNLNLLHSALSRQFVQFGGTPKWNDRIEICATLLFGLVKNHPFHDANKRTAFLTSILHLQKIKRSPVISGDQYEDFIVDIAQNSLDKYTNEPFDNHNADQCVAIIARFLRKATRNIDYSGHLITYQKLQGILAQRGFQLKNPKGNRIDLLRNSDALGAELSRPKRIAHIGFHGWSKQVSQKDIDIVREAAKLDASHGYDSQSFFNGLDDPLSLIRKYKEPLERLAFR